MLPNRYSKVYIILATLFSVSVLFLGYILTGVLPMFLFTFGFLGGLILWLLVPNRPSYSLIQVPFYLTLAAFVLHKWEERQFGFFAELSKITNIPPPDAGACGAILLYGFACTWLLIPLLVKRRNQFGYYLAWTFFTSMGVTELAHFVLPFFADEPYGYYPGMGSVIVLAPLGWWGMCRLFFSRLNN